MMVAQLLSSAKFCEFLFMLDKFLFDSVRAKPCPHCGAILHTANYKRKIYLNGIVLPGAFELRFATCCSRCRKRCFVPTVRFFERRCACAMHFLLCRLFFQKLTHKNQITHRNKIKLKKLLPVSASTIARWRAYFIEKFPELVTVKKLISQHVITNDWFVRFFISNSIAKACLMLLALLLIAIDELAIQIAMLIKGKYIHAEDD